VSLNDAELVRREYATDAGLARRISAYERFAEGPNPRRAPVVFVAERALAGTPA
jgi:hypothetical protein